MKKWASAVPVGLLIAAAVWMVNGLYHPYRGYAGKTIVVINPGMHAENVAGQLVRDGVLAHRLPFVFRYWLGRRHHETIKYGEYLFDRPLNVLEVYGKLVRGEVYLHSIVIPEGSDRFDIARIFQREIGLDPRAFLAATGKTASIRNLDPAAPTLEGYLFPDTYRFPRGIPVSRVIQTMVGRFRQVWDSRVRPQITEGSPDTHEVITLASLVEKETPSPAERPLIAGVFARRLRLRMPLQCDPTVIYALEITHSFPDALTGPLTGNDLHIDSSYNTYMRVGLPPGPICSPGLASILAALHPAPGKALYFVSNDHGGHVFADTLAEQIRNVARYRQLKAASARKTGTINGAHSVH
ncbi:MAG TPA: endolytic transglycosylase MltG [Terriglobia bacterium]|nr:endolytic transglycosylase MltG [Terriglobia bacterium]